VAARSRLGLHDGQLYLHIAGRRHHHDFSAADSGTGTLKTERAQTLKIGNKNMKTQIDLKSALCGLAVGVPAMLAIAAGTGNGTESPPLISPVHPPIMVKIISHVCLILGLMSMATNHPKMPQMRQFQTSVRQGDNSEFKCRK
jgi:hypothetical protein